MHNHLFLFGLLIFAVLWVVLYDMGTVARRTFTFTISNCEPYSENNLRMVDSSKPITIRVYKRSELFPDGRMKLVDSQMYSRSETALRAISDFVECLNLPAYIEIKYLKDPELGS
jgi:hypothetical protein